MHLFSFVSKAVLEVHEVQQLNETSNSAFAELALRYCSFSFSFSGALEIISHGSYEAQRHGDWPISMALTTVPELHCGTVKGIACLTNLLTSGVIEHDESRADLLAWAASRWCRSVQAYLKSFPMAPAKHNVTATGRLAWH